jgi:hypothetical protein
MNATAMPIPINQFRAPNHHEARLSVPLRTLIGWATGRASKTGSRSAGHRGRRSLTTPEPREPEHNFNQPVPIVARVVWADDGEEYLNSDTVALGWTGRHMYVRMTDTRFRLRAVWLDVADVTRR